MHVDVTPLLKRNHVGAGQSNVGIRVGLPVGRSDLSFRLVGLGVASNCCATAVGVGGKVAVGDAVTGDAVEAH